MLELFTSRLLVKSGMGSQNEELRALLREELAHALSSLRNDVSKLQDGLSDAVARIQSLERAPSSVASPRSVLRQASSEPPRKSSRGSVGFSSRAASDDNPISADTLILNTFPERTSRDEITTWLSPLVQQMVGDAEFTVTSRSKYSQRVFVRFSSAMRARAFSAAWRKEPRHFPCADAQPCRIYINWKLSASRSKEEYMYRQFFVFAKEVLQLSQPKLEKEKGTRTVYYDKMLLARVDNEALLLTQAGKNYTTIEKFQTWLAAKEEQRQSL